MIHHQDLVLSVLPRTSFREICVSINAQQDSIKNPMPTTPNIVLNVMPHVEPVQVVPQLVPDVRQDCSTQPDSVLVMPNVKMETS